MYPECLPYPSQKNSDAEFHSIVAKIANIERDQAKTINLGLFYGMGKNKLQAELGINEDKAKDLFNSVFEVIPH